MKILHIDSSILAEASASQKLTQEMVSHLKAEHADATIKYLDLAAINLQPLTHNSLGFRLGLDATSLTPEQIAENELTTHLIDQLFDADIIVLGVPMYNFTVTAQLKNWLDRLAQAGKTFKYTEEGPVGLVTGKKVYALSTRGGFYSTTEQGRAKDHQESYLLTMLAFMGMDDVTIIRAEGLAMGPEFRAQGMENAQAEIATLEV